VAGLEHQQSKEVSLRFLAGTASSADACMQKIAYYFMLSLGKEKKRG